MHLLTVFLQIYCCQQYAAHACMPSMLHARRHAMADQNSGRAHSGPSATCTRQWLSLNDLCSQITSGRIDCPFRSGLEHTVTSSSPAPPRRIYNSSTFRFLARVKAADVRGIEGMTAERCARAQKYSIYACFRRGLQLCIMHDQHE